MKQFLLTVGCVFVFSFVLSARHIIGGEISYTFLEANPNNGELLYRFRMRIYRDCQSVTEFDSAPSAAFFATITIFRDGTTRPTANSPLELEPPIQTFIDAGANSCLQIPDNICVEEGLYEFEAWLPELAENYYVVYQRCCRNETITNITEPGSAGATYYIQITEEAQRLRNSSPSFNNVPPLAVCLGEPLNFDFSGTDADGDSLTYEWCAPILGGGNDVNNTSGPNGLAPNPDTRPPYNQEVQFISPTYAFDRPLGDPSNLNIDTQTGVITGIPDRQGQFVMAVCVKEYRNGLLLSETRRDFQINVVQCQEGVVALIESDSILADQTYFFQVCQNDSLQFINQSFDPAFIEEVVWEFDFPNQDQQSAEVWSPKIGFPEAGTVNGRLILNPLSGCGDTAYLRVEVEPGTLADFDFDYDPCLDTLISFINLSEASSDLFTSNWDFGDGVQSEALNPIHQYDSAGFKTVTLIVESPNGCRNTTTQTVPYFPIDENFAAALPSMEICANNPISFDIFEIPINDQYQISWDFGDGTQSNAIFPMHTYERPGIYSVSISLNTPNDCSVSADFPDVITVLPSPIANFEFTPETPSLFSPTVTFQNLSIEANSFDWDFNGIANSTEENPIFTFPDTGQQVITLQVTHLSGCRDSMVKSFELLPLVELYFPNVFSPNEDLNNDIFKWDGLLPEAKNYEMMIWDRWGRLVFSTNNSDIGWDGRNIFSNQSEMEGVYVYVIKFEGPRGATYTYQGSVMLVR